MFRTILFLAVLTVAASAPFIYSELHKGEGPSLLSRLTTLTTSAEAPDSTVTSTDSDGLTTRALQDPRLKSLLDPPVDPARIDVEPIVTPLPDVLRFDLSQDYIMRRWNRVSSGLPDLNYHGLRVPVMTGTTDHDLHGSASYYFNKSHQVERIGIHGYTDDPDSIIQFVTSTYRLKEYAANGQRLFLSYLNGRPLSILRIHRPPPGTNSNVEIILEVNAPNKGSTLSEESLSYLNSLRQANLL